MAAVTITATAAAAAAMAAATTAARKPNPLRLVASRPAAVAAVVAL
jgi:hypothetical protein